MTNELRTTRAIFRLLFCLALSGLAASGVKAQTIYALSAGDLIAFDAQTPGTLTAKTAITGVVPGHQLMGLDFRPATGQLYALGYNSVSGLAELYTINPATAAATTVGNGPVQLVANISDLSFDFNPTVDRIRVTGSNGSNYRLHPVTGAIAATDGNLAFAAGDVNAGVTPNIGSGAYTNSYIGSTATTLYNYDFALNVLTTQNPPNAGTLNTVGASGLGLNIIDKSVDLDIWFDPDFRLNRAFLAANTGFSINDDLYSVNLSTGAVTLVGPIGSGQPVRDIAVLIERNVPNNVSGDLLYALTSTNNMISFDSDQPNIVRTLVPVTGLAAGQVLSGLDFRPATGELYALGYNAMTGEARLYTINPATGAATAIGAAPVTLAAGLGKVGFDFNPTVDRIRVTSSSNANYRLHPVTGALAFTDMNLAFAAGDPNAGVNPSIGAVAYTNSFNGATTTTLYNYDDSLNVLTTQAPPNNGTLNTVGASGITVNLADPTTDLDIFYDAAALQNRAYLSANKNTESIDGLYVLDLGNGVVNFSGTIGLGIAVTDIAAFLSTKITLSCPNDISATAALGSTSAAVTYTAPGATTTCATGGITITLVSGLASGSVFPAGDTEVVYAIADACGNRDTCRFTVTVNAPPCDSKSLGCLRFDILGISKTLDGDESYRIRVTNNCTSAINYVAFEVPDGITPVSPANNSTWMSDNGNAYTVRNPNFSPFYSVRFKTQAASGISGGQSDVFEYALPAQADVLYLYAFVRLADGSGTGVHLNTFDCAIQPYSDDNRPVEEATDRSLLGNDAGLSVYPNPSSGQLFADLSDWAGQNVELNVSNATGQIIQRLNVQASDAATLVNLPNSLGNGLYYLRLMANDGTQQVRRFVVQR